jgi:hypothetical protein
MIIFTESSWQMLQILILKQLKIKHQNISNMFQTIGTSLSKHSVGGIHAESSAFRRDLFLQNLARKSMLLN